MKTIFKDNHSIHCEKWSQLDAEYRGLILREASGDLADITNRPEKAYKLFNHLINQAPQLDAIERLHGVTGETNELYLASRGKSMVVGTKNADIIPVIGQVIASLLAGNEVILRYQTQQKLCEQVLNILLKSGLLPEVISIANDAQLATLLHMDALAVVAAVGSYTDMQYISAQLADSDGVISQLIPVTDIKGCREMFEPEYIFRFCTERVKTINTTAIGGNASLIELGMG